MEYLQIIKYDLRAFPQHPLRSVIFMAVTMEMTACRKGVLFIQVIRTIHRFLLGFLLTWDQEQIGSGMSTTLFLQIDVMPNGEGQMVQKLLLGRVLLIQAVEM